MKLTAFVVLAVLLALLSISAPLVSAQSSTGSPTLQPKPKPAQPGSTGSAATSGPGYKCDPSGICYCTGGSQSEDCKKLGGSTDCGQKMGCDGSGRCFCIPKAPNRW
jgi:hypothetical protein